MDGLGEMAGRAPLDEAVDSPAPSTHAGRSMSPADSISRCAVVGSVPTSHESLAESASGEAHVLVKEEAAAGADELSPDDELGKQDGLSVIVQPQDESRDSELLSPGKLSPTSAISVSVASMIDAGEFRSLQPEPTYQTLTSVNGRMSPPGFSPSSSYATLTPLQPLPPISTMSDKFAYGHAGNVSGSFTVMQNNGLGNMGLGMSVGSPYMGMSPPHHYSSPGHLGGMLPQQHSPLSPQSGYSQNGLHSPQKSLSPSGYDSPYAQRPAAVAPHSPALSPPSASLHSPPGAGVGVVTAAFQPAPLGALNGLPQLAAASASPHHSPHVVPSPSPPGFAPPPQQQPPPPQQQQQVVVKTVAGSSGGLAASAEVEEINTKELAQRISAELKRYSIPQAIFAQRVLCRSQGTLSDLLRNPKPWSKLKSGRETFRRMWKWLQEPEFQRMSALRLAGRKTMCVTTCSPRATAYPRRRY
ncbi:one cut domain family member 2 [Bacillus rossius redtenbacheri]|uniref:one cut domain family member 2 n=1 Tax=Bacillus rossius redtenbacheri TaxID=93214 RepID=UPI002FDDBB33